MLDFEILSRLRNMWGRFTATMDGVINAVADLSGPVFYVAALLWIAGTLISLWNMSLFLLIDVPVLGIIFEAWRRRGA